MSITTKLTAAPTSDGQVGCANASCEIVLSDPVYSKKVEYSWLETQILRLINDPRDLPFVWLVLSASLVLFPTVVYLYWPGRFRWWLGLGYFALNFVVFFDRFILMLHNTSHRPLFKAHFTRLNRYIPWVLAPFFGQTPDTYYAHHIGMHHPENNLHDDLSSTMRYRRDSFADWIAYFLRFFFLAHVQLGRYFWRKRRWKLLRRLYIGEATWWLLAAGLAYLNWRATLVVFIFPFVTARILMMAGNWAQHAFIDADDPANPYRNSITCINGRYNRRCFNDGYHIGHHVKANRHWTDMPADFTLSRTTYAENDAIVFREIDFFIVWAFLMMKRYRWLAHFYVDTREGPRRTTEQIIALLKGRILAIPPS